MNILGAIGKIVSSRKGLLWIVYSITISAMAFYLKGTYAEWGGYFLGGITFFGIGIQHDKKIDQTEAVK